VNTAKSAQERQDEIFRNMSADEKVKVGSYLWKMAKEVVGNKITYRGRGSKKSSG
jgi:hypothetical protein